MHADEDEQGAGLDRVPLACTLSSVTTALSGPFPCTSRISVHDRTVTPGCRLIWSTRYRDMLLFRSSPRITRYARETLRGEKDRRLARGVTTPDDDDRPRAAHQRFVKGGGVIHAVALERFDSWNGEPSIPGSRGQHHGPGHHRPPVRERYPVLATTGYQLGDLRGDDDPRSELAGLQNCPFGKVGSGDSAGESEIVLDPR